MNYKENLDLFIEKQIEEYKEALGIQDEENISILIERFTKNDNQFELEKTNHYNELLYLSSLLNGEYTSRLIHRFNCMCDASTFPLKNYEGIIPNKVFDYINDESNFKKRKDFRSVSNHIKVITKNKNIVFLHEERVSGFESTYKIIHDEWNVDVFKKTFLDYIIQHINSVFN
jgi:hypothetical protein